MIGGSPVFTLKGLFSGFYFEGFFCGAAKWCDLESEAKQYETREEAQVVRVKLRDWGVETALLEKGEVVSW